MWRQPAEGRVLAVQGKLAENLRRWRDYRQCKQIFLDPSLLLRQARVNALLDGKELIMPAPGLVDGFYLLKPFRIPFKELVAAVTYRGLVRHGVKLAPADISSLAISLFVGESLAVDRKGGRLGDGRGFFDLAVALLGKMGGVAANSQAIGAIDDSARIIEEIPRDRWDIRCAGILTPEGIVELGDFCPEPEIFWDRLPVERIKRISPLWKLRGKIEFND
ncbi:MAG: 5-formyltetrahydrofolate cyclo-ligase [Desulfurivibrionaceae bacterium]|nr:5-formyltetrahydrofolate cyclo-ligase [Desulfobulbales bacterium]MDT8335555.1 5-formyltetrahydrofolate cyclo-ligase [Desulfurivibrionaceae bacterium]